VAGDDIKKGNIIEIGDKLYQIMDMQHIKMKRTALLRMKLRDIRGGHTIEQTFQADEKFTKVRLESRSMQYLYSDDGLYHLMDEETFEQVAVNEDMLGDGVKFLKEGMSLNVSSYGDEIISVELPITVELEVTETEPGFKGDTATGGNKPATLETGLTVNVPLFVSIGDVLKVDTRTGQYLERA
jgi:elongation factor P